MARDILCSTCLPDQRLRCNHARTACRSLPGRGPAPSSPPARSVTTVGREHLVDQDELAGRIQAELELGVGDDDALVERVLPALVDRSRWRSHVSRAFCRANQIARVERDVLIVAFLGLGGWRKNRLWNPVAVDQPVRQRNTTDLAGLQVILVA